MKAQVFACCCCCCHTRRRPHRPAGRFSESRRWAAPPAWKVFLSFVCSAAQRPGGVNVVKVVMRCCGVGAAVSELPSEGGLTQPPIEVGAPHKHQEAFVNGAPQPLIMLRPLTAPLCSVLRAVEAAASEQGRCTVSGRCLGSV